MKANSGLRSICSVSTGCENDRFVGIKMLDGKPEVHFPIGFALSADENDLRKDVCLLIGILKAFQNRDSSSISSNRSQNSTADFPILAYQRMVLRYLNYGDYHETENIFKQENRGKVNWARTIKQIKPVFQESGPVYLNFITKSSKPLNNSMLAEIYRYCVYLSFQNIGWLYTDKTIPKPRIRFNMDLFKAIVTEKLSITNTDRDKELFTDMLAIINGHSEEGLEVADYLFGTFEFEYIWEKVIDRAFGIKDKKRYFPRSHWHLASAQANHALEPDTIMVSNGIVYVLDAKYYRYGHSANPNHLPDTSSIHKQITYGEFIYEHPEFGFSQIYNAFLLPGDLQNGPFSCNNNFTYIGHADSEWKSNSHTFEKVAGIVVDTKYLLSNYKKPALLADALSSVIRSNIST